MAQVSDATKLNFEKLNKKLESHEFSSRANKRDSKKRIVPTEYFAEPKNIPVIEKIVLAVENSNLEIAINSLIISLMERKGLITITSGKIESPYIFIKNFLSSFTFDENLRLLELPENERDPVGIIYQQLITEGEKNKKGSYYTPEKIVCSMLTFPECPDPESSFCDPCCGTGGFLLEAVKVFSPQQVFGYDLDPQAVKIARANLFMQFPNVNFVENIKQTNFLKSPEKYDYFITNPPWGSLQQKSQIPQDSIVQSGESFDYFIETALKNVSSKGFINFLLPVSVLNVKVHRSIRQFILDNYQIEKIVTYGKCFKGVMTDVVSLKISGTKGSKNYSYVVEQAETETFTCSVSFALEDKNKNIPLLDSTDQQIISKIKEKAELNLQNAAFALGIVTGNNSELLKKEPAADLWPIITGKDIKKCTLGPVNQFIKYDRTQFQQVCPDSFFQAPEKFVYRFISKQLVFAIDTNKCLTLNSANIMLLPSDFPLNKFALLALLNSRVMNFYFEKIINQVKVLKDDIQNLPLPLLPAELQHQLFQLLSPTSAKELAAQENPFEEIENLILDFYGFSSLEKQRILCKI